MKHTFLTLLAQLIASSSTAKTPADCFGMSDLNGSNSNEPIVNDADYLD